MKFALHYTSPLAEVPRVGNAGQTSGVCRLMLEKPNVLLLDEPTNHLDLESINALNSFLIEDSNPSPFPGPWRAGRRSNESEPSSRSQ